MRVEDIPVDETKYLYFGLVFIFRGQWAQSLLLKDNGHNSLHSCNIEGQGWPSMLQGQSREFYHSIQGYLRLKRLLL